MFYTKEANVELYREGLAMCCTEETNSRTHGESQQCAIYHCAVRGRTTVCFMKEKCCIAYIKRAVAVCRLTLWGNKVFIKISMTVYGYGRGLKKY